MKRTATMVVVLATVLALAAPASAHRLDNSRHLVGRTSGVASGCSVGLVSISRANPTATQARYVRVRAQISCRRIGYERAHQVIGVSGPTGGSRFEVRLGYHGLPSGSTVLDRTIKCNTKTDGKWDYPRAPLTMWSWAEVHNNGDTHADMFVARVNSLTPISC